MRMTMVPVPGHTALAPDLLAAAATTAGMAADTAPDLASALAAVQGPARVLVGGSLHLAGEFLRQNGPLPN
jgi:dihydrofolate synthase/folylpolyglutamate synthase